MKQAFYLFLNFSKFSEFIEFYWIGYFLTFWVFPEFILYLDPHADRSLGMQFVAEFIFGHATVAFSILALIHVKFLKTVITGLFIFLYGLFLYALSQDGAWLPVTLFVIYLIGKIRRAFASTSDEKVDSAQEAMVAFYRVMLLILSAIPAIFPWPKLGGSSVDLRIDGSGLFVEHPEKMLVYFIFYYSSIAVLENRLAKKHRRPQSS